LTAPPHKDPMAKTEKTPIFHVILSDRDEWVIEAEWSDGTLERVTSFKDHSAATDWIADRSDAWIQLQQIDKIVMDLRQSAKRVT
jgi:hypothetical protein